MVGLESEGTVLSGEEEIEGDVLSPSEELVGETGDCTAF